ncbi:MAG: 4-hydroxyacetophenone monooxygenase, partial [Pseudomonadota bacterium]
EAQMGYVAQALDRMDDEGIAAIAPNRQTQDDYNLELQRDLAQTVWGDPSCGASWYKTAGGRITQNWPHQAAAFSDMLKTFDLEAYESV